MDHATRLSRAAQIAWLIRHAKVGVSAS